MILCLLADAVTAQSQSLPERRSSDSEYAVYATGGLSNLTYKTECGTSSPGFSYGAGLEYICNVSSNFGLSTGVEYSKFAGSFTSGLISESYDAIDADGNPFEYTYRIEGYKESQSMSMLSAPIMLRVKFPVGQTKHIYAAGGVKFSLPLWSKVKISAENINSSAYYSYETVLYRNMPHRGFYNDFDVNKEQNSIKGLTTMIMLCFEAGIRFDLLKYALYTGIYFDYLPSDFGRTKSKRPMDYSGELIYESVLNTALISDMRMINLGLKLRISL